MLEFLAVVDEHTTNTPWVLLGRGYHNNEINALADQARNKGYTDLDVAIDLPSLTEAGRQYLADHRADATPDG